jgi:hypothetical protein
MDCVAHREANLESEITEVRRMKKKPKRSKKTKKSGTRIAGDPVGWCSGSVCKEDYEAGLDTGTAHGGTRSAYLRSMVKKPTSFGFLQQSISPPEDSIGKRLRMLAWMKTKDVKGGCQLWLRVEVEGRRGDKTGPCYDNMYDRRVTGTTDWTQYALVIDVPQKSYLVNFGFMLQTTGEAWLDNVTFEPVGFDVPLTSSAAIVQNLDFETD